MLDHRPWGNAVGGGHLGKLQLKQSAKLKCLGLTAVELLNYSVADVSDGRGGDSCLITGLGGRRGAFVLQGVATGIYSWPLATNAS